MFTERDVRNGSKVCVLGQTIVRELFGTDSPIGKEVRVQNVAFKVVGVLTKKGANMMGQDQDDIVLAPWTTVRYRVSGSSAGSASNTSTSGQGASTGTTSTDSNALYPSTQVELYPKASAGVAPLLKRFANVDQIVLAARTAGDVPGSFPE
jgi:hypothetical protein